jgi:hypothetical protein
MDSIGIFTKGLLLLLIGIHSNICTKTVQVNLDYVRHEGPSGVSNGMHLADSKEIYLWQKYSTATRNLEMLYQ